MPKVTEVNPPIISDWVNSKLRKCTTVAGVMIECKDGLDEIMQRAAKMAIARAQGKEYLAELHFDSLIKKIAEWSVGLQYFINKELNE